VLNNFKLAEDNKIPTMLKPSITLVRGLTRVSDGLIDHIRAIALWWWLSSRIAPKWSCCMRSRIPMGSREVSSLFRGAPRASGATIQEPDEC
jgi:hypothetical protein